MGGTGSPRLAFSTYLAISGIAASQVEHVTHERTRRCGLVSHSSNELAAGFDLGFEGIAMRLQFLDLAL